MIPPVLPSAVSAKTVCMPFIEIQHWNGHIMPIIIFIALLLKTSLNFGIIGATSPNTIQARVLPSAHKRNGNIPSFCEVDMPLSKEPAFAQVAAIDIA